MWLAALYGAKCTLKNDVNCNEILIESFIQNAKSLNRETDDYITYLETKFKCLVSLSTIYIYLLVTNFDFFMKSYRLK